MAVLCHEGLWDKRRTKCMQKVVMTEWLSVHVNQLFVKMLKYDTWWCLPDLWPVLHQHVRMIQSSGPSGRRSKQTSWLDVASEGWKCFFCWSTLTPSCHRHSQILFPTLRTLLVNERAVVCFCWSSCIDLCPPHSCLSISWISILCLWRFINYSNPPQFLLLSSCTAVWPLISLFSCTFCTRWTISRTRQHNAALMLDITEEYHGAESTVCKDPSSDGHSMVILRVCYGVTDSNEETDPE